ncbi:MAG: hypothetical protein KF718_21045 [Polyangiaceae bacterium]|nr:hypothetical protein [Polyangiaceae bacterium]
MRLVLPSFMLLAMAGCSLLAPGDEELSGGTPEGGAGGGSGGAPSGGAGGSGGTGGTGGGPSGGAGGSGAGASGGGAPAGGGGTGGSACTPTSGTAAARPVELYVLLHRSGGPGPFSTIKNQVSQFVNASASSGVSVGLQYVPATSAAQDCLGAGYSTPAVPFGLLPQHAAAIDASLSATSINTGGLFEGAAHGLASVGATRVAASPDAQFSAVLVPTSEQYGCSSSAPAVATILASAWPTVSTYVVPLSGALGAAADQWAAAGGTVDRLGTGSLSDLQSALAQAKRPCQFALPAGVPATNVQLTLNASSSLALPYRSTAGQCGGSDGWFVAPASAQTAVLCPVSCRKAIASSGTSVDFATTCD